MAHNPDKEGVAVTYGGGSDASEHHLPYKFYEKVVTYSDLETGDGDGDSDEVLLDDFPTDVYIVYDENEITEAWAGDGDGDGDDCAMIVGDTANDNEHVESFTLMGNSVGRASHTRGTALAGIRYEADWATAGAKITFSATDLADLASGGLIYRVWYFRPPLSTHNQGS